MTKQEYCQYEKTINAWIASAKYPSNCHNVTPWYSYLPCEICHRRLAGDRYRAKSIALDGEILEWDICGDCRYYLEYGRLDDMTMLDMDDAEEDMTQSRDDFD